MKQSFNINAAKLTMPKHKIRIGIVEAKLQNEEYEITEELIDDSVFQITEFIKSKGDKVISSVTKKLSKNLFLVAFDEENRMEHFILEFEKI